MDRVARPEDAGAAGWDRDQRLATLEQLVALRRPDPVETIDAAKLVLRDNLDLDLVLIYAYDAGSDALLALGAPVAPLAEQAVVSGLARLPLAEGGRLVAVFRTGRPYRTDRAGEDQEIRRALAALDLRSLLAVPYSADGTRAGVLQVASRQPARFGEAEQRFLATVANWLGQVAERLRAPGPGGEPGGHEWRAETVVALAHDLRNHLAPLFLRLARLEGRAGAGDRADLAATRRAAARLERLIATVLDTRRLELGLLPFQPAPVELVALAQEVAADFATETIPVVVHGPARLAARADPQAARRVLENLVVNAIRHSPRDAAVEITIADERRDGVRWVAIRVRDHGPGVAAVVRPRLFQRFAPGPGSRGVGLGLYLSRALARLHGGDVAVASAPAGGAIFTFAWPADTTEEAR